MAATRAKITIPYKPADLWREHIHPNLEHHRFSVIVAHRRFGKTVGTVNHVIKMAVMNGKLSPKYAYVAPFRNQAKAIAWEYLKYYTHVIPGVKKNESELYIELPSKHKGAAGARIQIIGADKPDNLRGAYLDGVILDEYAQIKPVFWNEVVRPMLADRKGWGIFVGTPKGQNQFYEIYKKARNDKTWYTCLYRADESGLFDEGGRYGPEELELMKKDMSEDAIRQELYCDFTASAYNVLITIDKVTAATERQHNPVDVRAAPRILGVDVARFGDDSCVIMKRQGLVAFKPNIYKNVNNMDFAAIVIGHIQEWNPDAVFIDAGRGEGVIDRCRQLGYQVIEVNFGAKSVEPSKYVNKRVEMWDSMRKWLDNGGSIPDVPELKTELSTPEYSFDAANRMKLESKEDIKEKLGKSPDIADALALTFAMPVASKNQYVSEEYCNTDYSPF